MKVLSLLMSIPGTVVCAAALVLSALDSDPWMMAFFALGIVSGVFVVTDAVTA